APATRAGRPARAAGRWNASSTPMRSDVAPALSRREPTESRLYVYLTIVLYTIVMSTISMDTLKGLVKRDRSPSAFVVYFYLWSRRGGSISHQEIEIEDRKSTRLNSSHVKISYAVFCLKKKKKHIHDPSAPQIAIQH